MKSWMYIVLLALVGLSGSAHAEPLPFTYEIDKAWSIFKNPESVSRIEYKNDRSLLKIKSRPTRQTQLTQVEVNEMNKQIVTKAAAQLIVVDGINGIYTRISTKKFFRTSYKLNCRFIKDNIEYFFVLDYKGRFKHFDKIEAQFIAMLNSIKWE